jgi:chemotaxis protein CheD
MNSANHRVSNNIAASQLEESRRKQFYLHPGQIFASRECHVVTTILGSCVSVCLWIRPPKSGINHFFFPRILDGPASPRYGDLAIRADRAVGRFRLSAAQSALKIFGGACVLEAFQVRPGHLGQRNVKWPNNSWRQRHSPGRP